MNKKLIVGILAVSATVGGIVAASKNDVAMTINGKDIKLSEFEYLYNKNKQQQLEEQTFDQYVDMFVLYKLKVADAEAAGIDTTASFLNEFRGYRDELANPYLRVQAVEDSLATESYSHMLEDVDVSHIMLTSDDPVTHSRSRQWHLADSLYNCVVAGEDIDMLARKYSVDPTRMQKGAHLGYITAGMTPYAFEKEAYNTPVGGVAKPFETQFGIHILKVNGRRNNRGQVLVEHIMKLVPRDASPSDRLKIKAKMDSIYNLVKNGGDFEAIAKEESDDPGSKREGGKLPWFGTGRMVPEFENTAYQLQKGEISGIIATQFGYHIIKKLDAKGIDSFEKVRPQILQSMSMDERSAMPQMKKIEELKHTYKYKLNAKNLAAVKKEMETAGTVDSAFIANRVANNKVLVTYLKKKITVGDVMKVLTRHRYQAMVPQAGYDLFERTLNAETESGILSAAKDNLEQTNPEFANLVNEYRDGLLLFEISNQRVWDKAVKDEDGLKAQFEKNRAKYAWDKPKFKGYLVQVSNDSVAALVKNRIATLGTDTLVTTLRKEFKKNIKIERVLVAQGENRLVDACEFAKDSSVKNNDDRYPIFFTYGGKIITAPEEYTDVRGQVIVDYQDYLEKEWLNEIKNKYPVKKNFDVLNAAK